MPLATKDNKTAKTAAPVANDAQTKERVIDPGAVQLVNGIIKMIDEMVSLMDKEIDLVEGRKMKDHAELLKRKQRLAIDYRASLKTIALQPDYMQHVPDDLRQAALVAGKKLSAASERNARVLRAAIIAVERLGKTIISIVKEEVMPKGAYANLQTGPAKIAYSPKCAPVTGVRTA